MTRGPGGSAVSDFVRTLGVIAPLEHAESWDNVGLLVGDPGAPVSKVLLTVDLTTAVSEEAERLGCELVVAYHPPIFRPLTRVAPESVIARALRSGTAVYSPHTALDVAAGGTNDVLAEIVGLVAPRPLSPVESRDVEFKLVTFVPEADLDRVRAAVFEAGAGEIGRYSSCGFSHAGNGSFFGGEGAKPAVGSAGRLEQAAEVRWETVVPIAKVDRVLGALRAVHPYEEPAFDLVRLASPPSVLGMGRIGRVESPSRRELVERVTAALSLSHALVAGPIDAPVRTAAVCAGSCGDLYRSALGQGADFFLTGEMRHHDALAVVAAGATVMCTLHSNSERATLAKLRDRLAGDHPSAQVFVSQADRDPFEVVSRVTPA